MKISWHTMWPIEKIGSYMKYNGEINSGCNHYSNSAMLQMWLDDVIRWDGFPKLRFSTPTLLCVCKLQYFCKGATEFDENFTAEEKEPVNSKYDVRMNVWNPQPRQPLSLIAVGLHRHRPTFIPSLNILDCDSLCCCSFLLPAFFACKLE